MFEVVEASFTKLLKIILASALVDRDDGALASQLTLLNDK